jgi:catechol 2,3-dioxygenase-like lactoylglutathione lyase family enzyme
MANVRYMVDDVDRAIEFYCKILDFELSQRWGPAFAIVIRDDLDLWLSGPNTSAARPMPDGRQPGPGGWNRLVITVSDIHSVVDKLKRNNVVFRNEVITGPGGSQALLDDPLGNPVEMFQPSS